MVSLAEIYREVTAQLAACGIDSARSDALRILEHCCAFSGRAHLITHGDRSLSSEEERLVRQYAAERAARLPLQYILGCWEFDEMQLCVGKGVLCPREDTLTVAEAAASVAPNGARIIDLCAGSGALGLSVMRRVENSTVTFVEISEEAARYLGKNCDEYGQGRTAVLISDLLKGPPEELERGGYDLITANPPYIPCGDIDHLAPEVLHEPRIALDGGEDGLLFYREICRLWLPLLRQGGSLCCEIGYDQAQAVQEIFVHSGLEEIAIYRDFGGNNRAIIGTMP